MSSHVHYTQISEPALLDVVDEAWARDRLPDDSERCRDRTRAACAARLGCQHLTRTCCCLLLLAAHTRAGIPLPAGAQGMPDDAEELQQEQPPPAAQRKERWLDLGLQHLH